MPHRINLIPEDGARPEITLAAVGGLRATGVQFERADPAIGEISELDEQGSVGHISEGFEIPLMKAMSGPSDRPCGETRSTERQ